MTTDNFIGLGFLLFGLLFLWYSLKYTIKNDNQTSNIKGIIAAIGAIILGIMLLTGTKWK